MILSLNLFGYQISYQKYTSKASFKEAFIFPLFLTGGTNRRNSQKNIRKSARLQRIYKNSTYVKWAQKLTYAARRVLLNEQTWLQHLKEKRLAYGLSQNRLAVATGITRQYLSDIETGKIKPSGGFTAVPLEALERLQSRHSQQMLFDCKGFAFRQQTYSRWSENILQQETVLFSS